MGQMSNTRPIGFCKDCRVIPVPLRADGGYVSRCPECAAKANAKQKAARAAAKARGRCAWEGGSCEYSAAPGLTYCSEHAEYHAERRRLERKVAKKIAKGRSH